MFNLRYKALNSIFAPKEDYFSFKRGKPKKKIKTDADNVRIFAAIEKRQRRAFKALDNQANCLFFNRCLNNGSAWLNKVYPLYATGCAG